MALTLDRIMLQVERRLAAIEIKAETRHWELSYRLTALESVPTPGHPPRQPRMDLKFLIPLCLPLFALMGLLAANVPLKEAVLTAFR